MAPAIATSVETIQIEEQVASNPLASLWLGILGVCLGGTLLCTATLVAWPIIANVVAG